MDIQKAIVVLNNMILDGIIMTEDETKAIETAVYVLPELLQYRQIGTVDECRAAREKQIPKEPKRIYKKYGKHKWKRKENGEIDEMAWDFDYHNGVICEICCKAICVCCNPDYDELEDCEEEYFLCPNCGKKHYTKTIYCDCGQALKWED